MSPSPLPSALVLPPAQPLLNIPRYSPHRRLSTAISSFSTSNSTLLPKQQLQVALKLAADANVHNSAHQMALCRRRRAQCPVLSFGRVHSPIHQHFLQPSAVHVHTHTHKPIVHLNISWRIVRFQLGSEAPSTSASRPPSHTSSSRFSPRMRAHSPRSLSQSSARGGSGAPVKPVPRLLAALANSPTRLLGALRPNTYAPVGSRTRLRQPAVSELGSLV